MGISISVSPGSVSEIDPVLRSNRSVSATISASTDDPINETVDFVSAALTGVIEPDLTIIPGSSSVSIIGTYADPFLDIFTFVSKRSSNKIETPTTVISIENMPANKELYNLNQDERSKVTKTFTVTVFFTSFGSPLTANFSITQELLNEIEPMRLFMDNYYN